MSLLITFSPQNGAYGKSLMFAIDFSAGGGEVDPKRLVHQIVFSARGILQEFRDALLAEDIGAPIGDFFRGSVLPSVFREKTVRHSVSDIIDACDCTLNRCGDFLYMFTSAIFFRKYVSSRK